MGTAWTTNFVTLVRRDNRSNGWNSIEAEGANSKGLVGRMGAETYGRGAMAGPLRSEKRQPVDGQLRARSGRAAIALLLNSWTTRAATSRSQSLRCSTSNGALRTRPDSGPNELTKQRVGQFQWQYLRPLGDRVDGAEELIERRARHDEP